MKSSCRKQRLRLFFCFAAFLLLLHQTTYAQTGFITEHNRSRITGAIDGFISSHKYKVSIFRLRPQVRIGAGFSTNSRYGSENQDNKADFYVSLTPGISAGVKFGTRAFARVAEDYTMRYQVRRNDLRYNFGATTGEFVTGTDRVLIRADGSYSRKIEPVNEEIDQPVENKYWVSRVGVEYSATSRMGLHHSVVYSTAEFLEQQITGDTIPLEDRKTISFLNGMYYALSEKVQLTGDVGISRSEATNSSVTTDRWSTLFGANYRVPKMTARAAVGFSQSNASNTDSNINTIILNTNANFLIGKRSHFSVSANRSQEFSFLQDNAVRTTSTIGFGYGMPVIKRIVAYTSYNFGKNDYGNQTIGGEIVRRDTFQNADVGCHVQVWRQFGFNAGLTYIDRNTDIPGLDQSHWNYYVGFGVGYTIDLLDFFL